MISNELTSLCPSPTYVLATIEVTFNSSIALIFVVIMPRVITNVIIIANSFFIFLILFPPISIIIVVSEYNDND